jgi:uncharacterized protein GlcG (DUF336 family)
MTLADLLAYTLVARCLHRGFEVKRLGSLARFAAIVGCSLYAMTLGSAWAQSAAAPRSQQPPATAKPVSPQAVPPALVAAPPPPPRHVARGPTMAAALKLAAEIEASCRAFHIGVSVIDSEATPKLFYVPDGTAGFHAFTAFRKANTALKFNMPSGKVADATKADPELAAKWQSDAQNYSAYSGGLLLMAGKEVIGAVGVSGAPTVQPQVPGYADEVCAIDGIKAVQFMLK